VPLIATDGLYAGILAGLVSITAGCATVMPWAGVIIGAVGGCVYRAASKMMIRMQIDDPVDACAVHGACGIWGVVSCSLLSVPQFTHAISNGRIRSGGAFYGDGQMLGGACIFLLAHITWVGILACATFMLLKRLGVLRVPRHLELEGMHAYSKGDVASVDDGSTHGGQPFWPAPTEGTDSITGDRQTSSDQLPSMESRVGNLRAAQPPPSESGIELSESPESSGALPTAAEGSTSGNGALPTAAEGSNSGRRSGRSGRGLASLSASLQASSADASV